MKQIVRKSFFALFVIVTMHASVKAQEFQFSREDKNEILSEFIQYLSISNVSDDVKDASNNGGTAREDKESRGAECS